jgi:striatin 1/3/4
MQNTNQFIVTYDTLKTIIYDTETGKILREISNDHSSAGDPNYRINRLISHPTQPIIITAHDDRKIRYFDSNSGMKKKQTPFFHKSIYSFVRSNDSFNGCSS